MTPEQERKLDHVGERVDALHGVVSKLSDRVLEHITEDAKRFAKADDRHQRTWASIRKIRDWFGERARDSQPRSRLPTLPEDTGSFEVGALGLRAKYIGPGARVVGIAALLLAVAVLAGYGGSRLAHASDPAQVAGERK